MKYLSVLLVACVLVVMLVTAAPADPSYIYAMHDFGGEVDMNTMGTKGWIVDSVALGHDPNNQAGFNYSTYTNNGYGVIARLNNGYDADGTLPYQVDYQNFAQRCANYVNNSPGCHIWIIGNETNLPREWPGNVGGDPLTGQPITIARYVDCYNRVYNAITALPGHSGDQIIPAAVGTWAPPYTAQGVEAFDDYFVNMLNALGTSKVKGIALHAYTHGNTPDLVTSEVKMGAPYTDIHYHFRVYKDYMSRIPTGMRTLPVYIPETGVCAAWADTNNGWMVAAYSEVNTWNQNNSQKIRCLAPFRWLHAGEGDAYYICDRGNLRADWRNAMSYHWTWGSAPTTGTITGWVKTAGGAAISGATVATSTGGYSTTTNSSGVYTLSNVTAGTYNVTASKSGYDSSSSNVTVTAGNTTTANFTLQVTAGGMNGNTPGGTNMATSGTATTDSNYSSSYTGAKAIDGVNTSASKWVSNGNAPPHWLAIDLGTNRTVNGFILRMPGQAGEQTYYNAKNFKYQSATSLSGPWTDEATIDNTAQASTVPRSFITPKSLRYVRLYITNAGIDNYSRINEFEVRCAGGGGPIASEAFTSMPSWSSTFDATWGSAATFSIVSGG